MKPESVFVGGREIGPGHPCFLVIEVGTTCLGDLDNALSLIKVCSDVGADAVKFQVIDPNQLSDQTVEYRFSSGGIERSHSMQDMFRKLQFSHDDWLRLSEECRKLGIMFLATVDYPEGVDLLDSLGVVAHKMGAWDITYKLLVDKIGKTGKPLFVDLGPASEEELDDLINWYLAAGGTAVLPMHDFHTKDVCEMNMRAIQFLNEKYKWPAGYSSPDRNDDLDFLALGLGANYLEKRLTLSRSLEAFHADESLEPSELEAWVRRIREAERSLGTISVTPSNADQRMANSYYRSICASAPISKGDRLTYKNLTGKRPGTGIPTNRFEEVIGRDASRDISANALLSWEDIV